MAIRIIDNKKVNMTDAEFEYYFGICRSYDRQSFKGEEMFKGLFESDDNGMIVFIHPPKAKATSMECYLYIIGVMHMQAVRAMFQKNELLSKRLEDRVEEALKKLEGK